MDNSYEAEIKIIEGKLNLQEDLRLMDEPEKKRSMFLHGLLASLLRGRLPSVLKSVGGSNGHEALRLSDVAMPAHEPQILNALMAWGTFDMKVSLLSQITKLEDRFKEYDKISQQPIGEEMKFAILLRCVTGQRRMHLNVNLKEDSSYESLREMILHFDRANIRWTEAMSLGTSSSPQDLEGGDGVARMDIDRVKGKDKGKGKKGKSKGGKDSKGKGKAKEMAKQRTRSRVRRRTMVSPVLVDKARAKLWQRMSAKSVVRRAIGAASVLRGVGGKCSHSRWRPQPLAVGAARCHSLSCHQPPR